jgi:hypothetical protein
MTPLVAEMAALGGEDSLEFHWFDLGEIQTEINSDEALIRSPLPYDKVALCGVDADGNKFLLQACQVSQTKDLRIFVVFGYVLQKSRWEKIPMLRIIINDGTIECVNADTEQKETTAIVSCGILADFLGRIEASSQSSFIPSHKSNHAKRARQGKVLMFDWRTIEIAPSRQRDADLGGTHASPRQHDRRGHWRKVGTNLVWVRACVVGDPAKGSVFKDYVVPGQSKIYELKSEAPLG